MMREVQRGSHRLVQACVLSIALLFALDVAGLPQRFVDSMWMRFFRDSAVFSSTFFETAFVTL